MIEPDGRPKRAEGVLAQRGSDTTYLLHVRNGQYYALSEVGNRIWDLCDGTRTLSEVVLILCGEYDVPKDTLEADVLELITDLAGQKLVDIAG